MKIAAATLHNAAHLVMLYALGREGALNPGIRPQSGCYGNVLQLFGQRSPQPATRQLVEEEAMVLLAGIVATQSLHPTHRTTGPGVVDMAEADTCLSRMESDAIVRRAWLNYLRHRVRAMLTADSGEARVFAVAELLAREGYGAAVRYLASVFEPRAVTAERGIDPPGDAAPPAEMEAVEEEETDWQWTPPPEPPKPLSPLIEDVMHLSPRTLNCLKNANILTVEQLEQRTDRDLARLKNVGRKTRDEIIAAAANAGITIRRVLWK